MLKDIFLGQKVCVVAKLFQACTTQELYIWYYIDRNDSNFSGLYTSWDLSCLWECMEGVLTCALKNV